jgi:GT2 family glycosyltransferase
MSSRRARVLVAITVYNGRSFVPATLRSAAALRAEDATFDVLILDDCSPDPGFSDEIRELCAELGHQYYRSPRNLGIPRNVNLGLLRAVSGGYSHVMICNSDILMPVDIVDSLLRVAQSDETIGSVTALSNNVSMYSLPNTDPDRYLSDQEVVNWTSSVLAGHSGSAAVDIPAGISFCVMVPTTAVQDVGLMDPVFGRGYCEESDWCLRSLSRGWRITLAPGTFVYHRGRGSNVDAGLLAAGDTTVQANEMIIDMRYPLFRSQVAAFAASGILQSLHGDATLRIISDAAHQFGYRVELTQLPSPTRNDLATVSLSTDPTADAVVGFSGFSAPLQLTDDPIEELEKVFGRPPEAISVMDRSRPGAASRWPPTTPRYPTRV